MMMMRRRGSIGRSTKGGTVGGGGAVATGGGAAGGVRTAALAAGAGFGVDGLLMAGGAEATGAAGAEAAAGGGGVGAGAATAAGGGAGGGEIALTAAWQPPDSLGKLRLRHSRASLPPGCTPEQLAMKSERQFARMALVCAAVGCCACAAASPSITVRTAAPVARPAARTTKPAFLSNATIAPLFARHRPENAMAGAFMPVAELLLTARVFTLRPI